MKNKKNVPARKKPAQAAVKEQNKVKEPIAEAAVETEVAAEATVVAEASAPSPKTEKARKPEKSSSPAILRVCKYLTAAVVVLVLFWFGFTTQVREGNCAVILRFGAVREEVTEAGLYFKLPWPFETVKTYDARAQYLESNSLETTTKDKRNIIIQSYVVWQVSDPVLYHNSVGTQGSVEAYIRDQVFSATNSTMGTYNLTALVSLEKEEIKIDTIRDEIFTRVHDNCLKNYGVTVTDVSILRLSLPETNLQSVFDQMKADRQKDIDLILANAYLESNRITSEADTEAAHITADGVTQAAEIRAATETEVAHIYAQAQAANIELYKFLRNLDTVVSSVDAATVLVVKADEYPFNVLTEYAKYMTDEDGNATVVNDLSYILTQLPEADRAALVDAIGTLIETAAAEHGITLE